LGLVLVDGVRCEPRVGRYGEGADEPVADTGERIVGAGAGLVALAEELILI
jgi:hypothetical protein